MGITFLLICLCVLGATIFVQELEQKGAEKTLVK
jgi:hypothetical protein